MDNSKNIKMILSKETKRYIRLIIGIVCFILLFGINVIESHADDRSSDGVVVITQNSEKETSVRCEYYMTQALEYKFTVTGANSFESDWMSENTYTFYLPKSGDNVLTAYVRYAGDNSGNIIYQGTVSFYHNNCIKGICQMPYNGEGGGYLIGIESYENPNQRYSYEMLILDCNLYVQGLPAWIYTTTPCYTPSGNALWTVWQPVYGYYWTLFRVYDENNHMIGEEVYGFVNVPKTKGEEVVEDAMQYLGLPYKYGSSDLSVGTDCSGFTKAIYAHFGYNLSPSSKMQINDGVQIGLDELQPGDLIFWSSNNTDAGIYHVAIYTGYMYSDTEAQIVHNTVEGSWVKLQPMRYMGTPYKAVRVIQ